jgi:hypothetical protein
VSERTSALPRGSSARIQGCGSRQGVSIYASMHVPEGLFAVWHNWVWAGNRLEKERQVRKKQLKHELAKETRFRPAGHAPGFHYQANAKAYNAVSLTRPAVVLAHESLGAGPLQMSRNVEQSEYAASRTSPDTHRFRALNSRQWTGLLSRAGQRHRRQETQKDLSKDSAVWRLHAFQQESA